MINFSKPQYTPAIGLPLNLFHCEFRSKTCRKTDDELMTEEEPLEMKCTEVTESTEQADIGQWIYNEDNLQKLIENIQSEWTQFSIKYDIYIKFTLLYTHKFKNNFFFFYYRLEPL